ncbi:hypothetical protein GQ53DRAFT_754957 [Thozetella sp. PMI_491]|nr:hypothetical protein GQ53DRAFT_754957 [Thozetella sp. PMI_491]
MPKHQQTPESEGHGYLAWFFFLMLLFEGCGPQILQGLGLFFFHLSLPSLPTLNRRPLFPRCTAPSTSSTPLPSPPTAEGIEQDNKPSSPGRALGMGQTFLFGDLSY